MLKVNIIKSNLLLRSISTLALVGLYLIAMYNMSITTIMTIGSLIHVLMIYEWLKVNLSKDNREKIIELLAGTFLITLSYLSLLISVVVFNRLREVMMLTFIITTTDIFAMLGGRNIGGIKLAPKISPKKTWSGLICGIIGAQSAVTILTFIIYQERVSMSLLINYILITTIIAINSQMSDLLISYFKRRFNKKDFGSIISGHGGVLDRFDSYILNLPLLLILSCCNFCVVKL